MFKKWWFSIHTYGNVTKKKKKMLITKYLGGHTKKKDESQISLFLDLSSSIIQNKHNHALKARTKDVALNSGFFEIQC